MPRSAARTIVITGVTRGLGRAMAEQMVELGHRVFGCGRSAEAIRHLQHQLGAPHDFDEVDVTHPHVVEQWAKKIIALAGAPDLLVNNAAIINTSAPLWQVPAEELDRVVDINIKGVANVIRAFLPAMIERGSGVVVNFSSYWGRSVAAEVATYCATKWAIEGLSRALAQELPDGLAAVAFNPGVIDTEMLRTCFGDSAASYARPEEWAREAVPYLLGLGPKDNGKSTTAPGQ